MSTTDETTEQEKKNFHGLEHRKIKGNQVVDGPPEIRLTISKTAQTQPVTIEAVSMQRKANSDSENNHGWTRAKSERYYQQMIKTVEQKFQIPKSMEL